LKAGSFVGLGLLLVYGAAKALAVPFQNEFNLSAKRASNRAALSKVQVYTEPFSAFISATCAQCARKASDHGIPGSGFCPQ
jgi:hypothetical protein